jgi:DNA repair exonuclease SbcCD ATPase subunit
MDVELGGLALVGIANTDRPASGPDFARAQAELFLERENTRLEDMVERLESENKHLRSQKADLEKENEHLKELYSAAQAEVKRLYAVVDVVEEENADLEKDSEELCELKQKLHDLAEEHPF